MKLTRPLALALALAPSAALADVATLWAEGKAVTTGATGLVADRWDGPFGYGAAAGVEFIGLDLFAEALMFGPNQYQFTGNFGVDLVSGDDVRFGVGLYTGPIVYVLAEPSSVSGFNTAAIPTETQSALESAGVSLSALDAQYQKVAKDEETANRTLFGWNARARASVEYALLPVLFLGVEGSAGLHYILSGETATAAAKNKLVQQTQDKYPSVPEQAWEDLRVAFGADKKDNNEKTGINWDAGVFLKFEL